jgi:hypothetical protein
MSLIAVTPERIYLKINETEKSSWNTLKKPLMRAKMVEKLSSYPWSSYPVFIGKKKAPNWLETEMK